jgi:hypothetical protein
VDRAFSNALHACRRGGDAERTSTPYTEAGIDFEQVVKVVDEGLRADVIGLIFASSG